MFLGANSSRPTGSFRQRPKTYKARKVGISDASRQRKQTKLLTDVDHYLTLREPCVASLRSDRHEIGMTDRHHRNAQISALPGSPSMHNKGEHAGAVILAGGQAIAFAACHDSLDGCPKKKPRRPVARGARL